MDRECSGVIRRLSVLPDVTHLDPGGMLVSHGLNHNAMIWGIVWRVCFLGCTNRGLGVRPSGFISGLSVSDHMP